MKNIADYEVVMSPREEAASMIARFQASQVDNIPEAKVCKKCGRELPMTNFRADPKREDGRLNTCRECVAEAMRKTRMMKDAEMGRIESYRCQAGPVKTLDGRDPRELIEEIKANFAALRRVGYTCEATITFPKTIKL